MQVKECEDLLPAGALVMKFQVAMDCVDFGAGLDHEGQRRPHGGQDQGLCQPGPWLAETHGQGHGLLRGLAQ